MVIEDPAQPIYWCGWHIPEGIHPDRVAIDAMMDYLGQGRTSMLYKNLVKEKKMALQVQAFAGLPGNKYPTMAHVLCIPAQGHDNYECEQEIFAEIDRFKEHLLTDEELNAIKARARASFINGLDSNNGLAQQLASVTRCCMATGARCSASWIGINAVTAEDCPASGEGVLHRRRNRVGGDDEHRGRRGRRGCVMRKGLRLGSIAAILLVGLLIGSVAAQDLSKLDFPKLGDLEIPEVDKVTLPNGMRPLPR